MGLQEEKENDDKVVREQTPDGILILDSTSDDENIIFGESGDEGSESHDDELILSVKANSSRGNCA